MMTERTPPRAKQFAEPEIDTAKSALEIDACLVERSAAPLALAA